MRRRVHEYKSGSENSNCFILLECKFYGTFVFSLGKHITLQILRHLCNEENNVEDKL
ncbi:hypothetical protein JHK86_045091 [Glycine max]|nr:hypothetical protein JHK86_045091 [Glycine max]